MKRGRGPFTCSFCSEGASHRVLFVFPKLKSKSYKSRSTSLRAYNWRKHQIMTFVQCREKWKVGSWRPKPRQLECHAKRRGLGPWLYHASYRQLYQSKCLRSYGARETWNISNGIVLAVRLRRDCSDALEYWLFLPKNNVIIPFLTYSFLLSKFARLDFNKISRALNVQMLHKLVLNHSHEQGMNLEHTNSNF